MAKLVDSRDPTRGRPTLWKPTRAGSARADPGWIARSCRTGWPTRLLDGFRQRENLSWSAPWLHLVDLAVLRCPADKGLRLLAGRAWPFDEGFSHRTPGEECGENPTDSARISAANARRFGADIAAASWTSGDLSTWAATRWFASDAGAAAG